MFNCRKLQSNKSTSDCRINHKEYAFIQDRILLWESTRHNEILKSSNFSIHAVYHEIPWACRDNIRGLASDTTENIHRQGFTILLNKILDTSIVFNSFD